MSEKEAREALREAERELERLARRYDEIERRPVQPDRLAFKNEVLRRYRQDIASQEVMVRLYEMEVADYE